MSPRRRDPELRPRLVDVAARLLLAEGPQALTTRRIATEAGCSTMAVYTNFGGMPGLVREMVREGFARLDGCFSHVRESDDPVADMFLLGWAYRRNALTYPHLYKAMFGAASIGDFSLDGRDRRTGRYTLEHVVRCAGRCIAAGRFTDKNIDLVGHLMWTAVHGVVTLELGGYLIAPYTADVCFDSIVSSLMVSVGDTPEATAVSLAIARERLATVGLRWCFNAEPDDGDG
jgi:AcrR family transcriptional regulator